MPPLRTSPFRCSQAALFCSSLLVFAAISDAGAGTARSQKQAEFVVPLQPFSLDLPEVHKPAPSVAAHQPRILRASAVAPLKVGSVAPRAVAVLPARSEQIEDQADESPRPTHIAYEIPRGARPAEPHRELADDEDSDQDASTDGLSAEDEDSHIERGGDHPIVTGNRAVLRNGIAYAPSRAPQSVKNAIWAVNSLRRKPYVWGGGHRSFYDYGYDCSGSVSFALHRAGLLAAPLPSSDLVRYGERGRGRWITIYSRPGHTFAIIAGLRLDTTDMESGDAVGPRWYVDGRDTRHFVARHPAGL